MKNPIEKIDKLAEGYGNPLLKRVKYKRPMLMDYHPDLDVSKELEDPNMYQHIIVILRWSYDLYWIGILTELSVLSQHFCNPREGHLDAVFQIFNYLNVKRKFITEKLIFDDLEHPPYICSIKGALTEKIDWMDL